MSLPKILFCVDVPNWAFDFRAKTWKRLLSDKFDIDIRYLKDYKPATTEFFDPGYDGYVFFFYKALTSKIFNNTEIPYDKIALSINSEKWKQEGSKFTFDKYLQNVKLIIACNDCCYKTYGQYTKKVKKVTQCVSESIFHPVKRKKSIGRLKVGWSGNPATRHKNIDYLYSICNEIPEICLDIQKNLNQKHLNNWYSTLDLVLCTSDHEGGPNMILEAGACKLPMFITSCGLSNELIEDKVTGRIIPFCDVRGSVDIIKETIKDKTLMDLMATNLHDRVMNNWTYAKRIYEIEEALTFLVK